LSSRKKHPFEITSIFNANLKICIEKVAFSEMILKTRLQEKINAANSQAILQLTLVVIMEKFYSGRLSKENPDLY